MASFKIRTTVGCEELSSSFNEYKIEDKISEQQQENKQILNFNNIEEIKRRLIIIEKEIEQIKNKQEVVGGAIDSLAPPSNL